MSASGVSEQTLVDFWLIQTPHYEHGQPVRVFRVVFWCKCLWRTAPLDCHWVQSGPSRGRLLKLLTCLQDFSEPLIWWWKIWISWVGNSIVSSQIYHQKSSPFHPEKIVEVGWVGEGLEARISARNRPLSPVGEGFLRPWLSQHFYLVWSQGRSGRES